MGKHNKRPKRENNRNTIIVHNSMKLCSIIEKIGGHKGIKCHDEAYPI